MRGPRRGMALALAIALILVLGAFGAIVRVLSHAAYREVDTALDHLSAALGLQHVA